jgi:hypothetical protein
MMRGIAATLVLLLSAAPVSAATQPYTITSFDGVRVLAPVRVVIATGVGVSARGQGARDALDRVDMAVSGTLLTIRMKAPQAGEKAAGPVTLNLSTGRLGRVMLSGSGSVAIDRMNGLRGELVLDGGGDMSVGAVALDRLDVIVTGSGRVTLAGNAGVLNVNMSGPGAAAAEGLQAKQVKIVNNGPGSIALTALTSADISTRGSGDVMVTGKGACKVNRGGTGRIVCGGVEY